MKVDCPEDVASYIHRVGRTARYHSGGRSVLFLMPSEMKMLEQLQSAKVPIQLIKVQILFLLSHLLLPVLLVFIYLFIYLLLFYKEIVVYNFYIMLVQI